MLENFISRLEHCKQVGDGRYKACCPAHQDRSPSLTVTDTGTNILIHCFAGCSPLDVINAVGLQWPDLYPPDPNYSKTVRRRERDHFEETVVKIAESTISEGKKISEADKKVVIKAKLKLLSRG